MTVATPTTGFSLRPESIVAEEKALLDFSQFKTYRDCLHFDKIMGAHILK